MRRGKLNHSENANGPGIREGRQSNVLLVEDERFVREVASEILEAAGYRVLKARNATEARKVFQRSRETVDILITDVVLPDKNGCGLSDELQIDCPRLKTIFMSGYPEQFANFNGRSQRTSFLAKPFSVDSLLKRVYEATTSPAAEWEPQAKHAVCSG